MRKRMFFIAPLAIVGIVLFIFIGGEVVKLLWNWLVPSIIGWRQINFWEAFGLLALCRILFGGHGWHRSGKSGMGMRWKERMNRRTAERWEKMTPEEREKARQGFSGRCAPFEPPETKPAE
jgi:hypothetical protein